MTNLIRKALCLAASTLLLSFTARAERATDYVDPKIGAEGLGRVYIGPANPFGMVRPGPDCTPSPNSGWLPMPERVDGFAQTHVSGTGGGPKYGNILIQPYLGDLSSNSRPQLRAWEDISLGRYATAYEGSGIQTEVTTAPRASFYRITFPATYYGGKAAAADQDGRKGSDDAPSLLVDAGFFLGETPVPDAREAQQLVGSQVQILSDQEVAGYSRIRGGWNNGRAYTVYFHLLTDRPFVNSAIWQGGDITPEAKAAADLGGKTGALLQFPQSTDSLNVAIGISFISELKARENLMRELKALHADGPSSGTFDAALNELKDSWEDIISRVQLSADTPEALKRMVYTGLYHTMLMPSDRTGENPLWTDPGIPYYDDFYAIWDTYRTSLPLITLLDPARQTDIVNSLINIAKRDGYMPDARSGNANGRTQGGSNADVVVADAYVKNLKGIDWEQALEAMLRDGEVDPGYDHEAHGRGGLNEYTRLGYVPFGHARSGNRTVEYSLCDYAIAQVAKGLGRQDKADKFGRMAHSWRNLWRSDYTHDGARGFIMPRDAQGRWMDSIPFGHSKREHPRFAYKSTMFEGPWYTPWWSMFFYEASSWEYSLSMPHDVKALIDSCGGPEQFARRLDTFFDHGYYNVNNEPSFLTPCLYHWLGRPDKSSDRVRQIVKAHFNDTPRGLPGNDDSGAMSSWLVFHILGLYPNAAHPYYLINSPMVTESTLNLPDGKPFTIRASGLSDKNRYIASARLNGEDYPWSTLTHDQLLAGGVLELKMASKPMQWGSRMLPDEENPLVSSWPAAQPMPEKAQPDTTDLLAAQAVKVRTVYYLHGQKRRFDMTFTPTADGGMMLRWGIERNLHWWDGTYRMTPEAVASGTDLSYIMPEDGNHLTLNASSTFAMLSLSQLNELKTLGSTRINGTTFTLVKPADAQAGAKEADRQKVCPLGSLLEARSDEGAVIRVVDNRRFPLIWSMTSNPLEIDWQMSVR